MRKIIVHDFISLDGVIQAPGGETEDTDGGFTYGGWTRPYWHNDMGISFGELMQESDAFLLGRKTWEIHGTAFNPMKPGDPFGDMMNNVKKFVVSTTLKSPDLWRNSTIISGNVVEEVKKLKNQPGKNILVDGSSVLMQTLFEHDLVDELRLNMYPIVLGNGKRLFAANKHISLKLLKSKEFPTGVISLQYEVKKAE